MPGHSSLLFADCVNLSAMPGIHVPFADCWKKTWMAGTSPAVTGLGLIHLSLVADRAKMLVDAKHDQNEFRRDAREHDSDEYPGDRGQQQNEPGSRLAIRRARCWFVQSSVREGWARLPEARVFFGLYHPRELV